MKYIFENPPEKLNQRMPTYEPATPYVTITKMPDEPHRKVACRCGNVHAIPTKESPFVHCKCGVTFDFSPAFDEQSDKSMEESVALTPEMLTPPPPMHYAITTKVREFCEPYCKTADLYLEQTRLYSQDKVYDQMTVICCKNEKVCEMWAERVQKAKEPK